MRPQTFTNPTQHLRSQAKLCIARILVVQSRSAASGKRQILLLAMWYYNIIRKGAIAEQRRKFSKMLVFQINLWFLGPSNSQYFLQTRKCYFYILTNTYIVYIYICTNIYTYYTCNFFIYLGIHTYCTTYSYYKYWWFFLVETFKTTLSQNAVNLAANETTRNNFYFHHSWKFTGYFSQAYPDRKGPDVWNFDHSITLYGSEQQAATVFTETKALFLYWKSFFLF